jgi:hypothetical protein
MKMEVTHSDSTLAYFTVLFLTRVKIFIVKLAVEEIGRGTS